MVEPTRVCQLNSLLPGTGNYVLYWMQSSVRTRYNAALQFAIEQANELRIPVVAYFGLVPQFPDANLRHYTFLVEGLEAATSALAEQGIKLVIRTCAAPPIELDQLARQAALVVVDRGYTRPLRHWYRDAAQRVACPLIQIEDNVVVPIETASPKEEYAARTLRPRIQRLLPHYLRPAEVKLAQHSSLAMDLPGLAPEELGGVLENLAIDHSVSPMSSAVGGELAAQEQLATFITHNLDRYAVESNDPALDVTSHLSAYLHFGHISPLEIALRVQATESASCPAFLEQLIIRRELAINYCHYSTLYDRMEGLPAWARLTLKQHAADPRPYLYSPEQLENGETHDPYWNAAQWELRLTGRMHNYMRMYWGKKIIEWTASPEKAFERLVYLNDRYELDGRSENGYTGIAWCFGKHDRPWKERPIFGKVRYMNARGLERKFDIKAYAERIEALRGQNAWTKL